MQRAWGLLLNLAQGLWFVPALLVVAYGGLANALIQLDHGLELADAPVVFAGDGSAARTVLSVLAGSLITVAGLTLSLTVVVLQLAASQFSPRILRTFFGDRLTQVTIGSFVGIFVYSIFVLRSVGSVKEGGSFVPRLSVTVASALGIAAVVLLIFFIHHLARLIQVSHVTARIGHETLERLDTLYPEPYGEAVRGVDTQELLAEWRREPGGAVLPKRPGYVQRIELDALADALGEPVERLALHVRPGDFASVETPLAEVWPAAEAERVEGAVRGAVTLADERDLRQDVAFGVRQLADTAVRAMSPGINDPTTATTCIGYIRAVLARLAGRSFPAEVRHGPRDGLMLIVPTRAYEEYLEALLEIGRYSAADDRVVRSLLDALRSVAETAARAGAAGRAGATAEVARTVAGLAADEAKIDRDREAVQALLGEVERAAATRWAT